MIHPLFKHIQAGPMLADGAMGTMLHHRGVPFDRCFEELNISDPAIVLRIHRDYLRTGARLIETNTFGANAVRLGAHGLEHRVDDINTCGVTLAHRARDVEGVDALVAGSLGPTGQLMAPRGPMTVTRATQIFTEQAAALCAAGVDLLIIETFFDPAEISCAIDAARRVTDLPVIAQMTFADDGRTLTGHTPEDIGRFLQESRADLVGANCSTGPQITLDVLTRLRTVVDKPLSAMPNAGVPRLVNGRFVYPVTPGDLAGFAEEFLANGVRILGGCCGTTPDHITALAAALHPDASTAFTKNKLC